MQRDHGKHFPSVDLRQLLISSDFWNNFTQEASISPSEPIGSPVPEHEGASSLAASRSSRKTALASPADGQQSGWKRGGRAAASSQMGTALSFDVFRLSTLLFLTPRCAATVRLSWVESSPSVNLQNGRVDLEEHSQVGPTK